MVLLSLIGLTYAYFRMRVFGNNTETSLSVQSEKLGNYLLNTDKSVIIPDLYKWTVVSSRFSGSNGYGTDHVYYFSNKGISSNREYYIYNYPSCGLNYCSSYYYTLINSTTNTTFYTDVYNYTNSSPKIIVRESILNATGLKPVIVLDTTNVRLSQTLGTKNSPYEIIVKG